MGRIKRLGLTALVAALMVAAAAPIAEGGSVTRTKGDGWFLGISWMEIDREDLLGLPGNVHTGFMFGFNDQYGQWLAGHILDWECPEGELPWHGGAGVVANTSKAVERATDDTVDAIVDSGARTIDTNQVTAVRRTEATKVAFDEFEEPPSPCDLVQERALDGSQAKVVVDRAKGTLNITGTLIVTGGHGGGGPVLGRPPANISVSGGSWEKFEESNKFWGEGYKFENHRNGTRWDGGRVTGSIGAMGFDDDPDDTSFAHFEGFAFRTVARIR